MSKFKKSIPNTIKEWQIKIKAAFAEQADELNEQTGERYIFESESGASYRVYLEQVSPRKLVLFFEVNTNVSNFSFLFEEYVVEPNLIEQFLDVSENP